MKKVTAFSALALSACFFVACASAPAAKSTAKTVFEKDYKLNFDKEVLPSFSVVDIDEELDVLKYLMKTTYAGYEKAVENGFDIDRSIAEIKHEALTNLTNLGMVDTPFLQKKIFDVFDRDMGLNDMHFSVAGYNVDSYKKVARDVVWTDVYIGEEDGEGNTLVVIESPTDRIPLGAKYTGEETNLYKVWKDDKIVYRFGAFSNPRTKRLSISLNGESMPVTVVESGKWFDKANNVNVIETDGCVYVSLSTFSLYSEPLEYNMFYDMCKNISNTDPEKPLILDLRSNGGGNGFLASQLVASIFFPFDIPLHMEFYDFLLHERGKVKEYKESSAFKQGEEHYKNYREIRNALPDEYNRDFEQVFEDADIAEIFYKEAMQHKKVYVLMNSNTASASEYTIGLLGLVPECDVTLIGSRTVGAVEYVGSVPFPLPKSGLRMYLGIRYGAPPFITDDDHFYGEGEGFYPDWWVSNDQILNTLVQLTGDTSLFEYLKGLEKWQL